MSYIIHCLKLSFVEMICLEKCRDFWRAMLVNVDVCRYRYNFIEQIFFHHRQDSSLCNFCNSMNCLRKILSFATTFTSTFSQKWRWTRWNVVFISTILHDRAFIVWVEYASISKSLNRYMFTQTFFNDVHEKTSIINACQFVFFDRTKRMKLIFSQSSMLNRQFSSFDFFKNSI